MNYRFTLRHISLILLLFPIGLYAQIPPGYYDNAIGDTGVVMKMALHNIIKGHTSRSYTQLWTDFQTTDKKANGKVWDIYSDNPGGTPPYEYTFVTDQCGNYSTEGDCYNREHSFPKSWFSKASPMYTDLFHLYPTDGKVNGMRSDYPYGEVGTATWTSLNGSKLGACVTAGYSGTVFEPIDAYKGDLARTYFYMAVRYYTEDGSWPGSAMVNGAEPKPWALAMLYQWHLADTVSQKEIDRNNAIYGIQHNRNPFIDHPEWVDSVWFPKPNPGTGIQNPVQELQAVLAPNPVQDAAFLIIMHQGAKDWIIDIYDLNGKKLQSTQGHGNRIRLETEQLAAGAYFVRIRDRKMQWTKNLKLIKQ